MIALFVHDDASADLTALWGKEPEVAAQIVALLQELAGDLDLLDRLTQYDFGAHRSKPFHVDRWWGEWNRNRNLWRLKIWDLEDKGMRYRIIYAFEPKKQHYHVLAIAPRDFGYDPKHALSQRILRAYEEL